MELYGRAIFVFFDEGCWYGFLALWRLVFRLAKIFPSEVTP